MLGFHPTHINIHVGAKAGRSQPRSKVFSPTGRVGENPENKVEKITLIVHWGSQLSPVWLSGTGSFSYWAKKLLICTLA